jgi:hypothetical protein
MRRILVMALVMFFLLVGTASAATRYAPEAKRPMTGHKVYKVVPKPRYTDFPVPWHVTLPPGSRWWF